MQEYLTLTIQNAKRFHRLKNKDGTLKDIGKGKISKDQIIGFDGNPSPRTFQTHAECPANTLLQTTIANVLRVLCGERPVPSGRDIRSKKAACSDSLFEGMASEAMVRHLNAVNQFGASELETMQTHPCLSGSLVKFLDKPVDIYNPSTLALTALTWDRLQAKLRGKEHVLLLILELGGVKTDSFRALSLFSVLRKARESFLAKSKKEQAEIMAVLENSRVKPLGLLIKDGGDSAKAHPGDIGSWLRSAKGQEMFETRRREFVTADDYEVYIPVGKELRKEISVRLGRGRGFATCMEGGLARLGLTAAGAWTAPVFALELPEGCVKAEKRLRSKGGQNANS
jgi:hypothetical protein